MDTILPLLLSRFIPWDVYWNDRYAWRISAALETKRELSVLRYVPHAGRSLWWTDGLTFITLTVCTWTITSHLCREEVADRLTENGGI